MNKERADTFKHKADLEQRITEVSLYAVHRYLNICLNLHLHMHLNPHLYLQTTTYLSCCLQYNPLLLLQTSIYDPASCHMPPVTLLQVKASVKSQGGEGEDPDSRMDSERTDRRDKKGGKTKVGTILTTLDGCLFVQGAN